MWPFSNSDCSSFMVASGLNPRRTEAACWTVAVVKGGGGLRLASRRSQESTCQGWRRHQATVFSARASSVSRWASGSPFQAIRRVAKGGGVPERSSRAARMK